MNQENLNYIISTDSGCDLSIDVCKENNIIPLLMNYYDEEKIYTDTMKQEDIIKLYNRMIEGKMYKTTAVNITEGYKFLKSLMHYNQSIVHIALGSGISGTYNNMVQAKEFVLKEYPNANITIIDSTLASLGYGLLVLEASKLRKEGKTISEVISYIENNKSGINPYFTTNTLTYLARGGRVTKIASIFGNVLSIRPILRLDDKGHLLVHAKGHGKTKTIKKMKELVEEAAINPQEQTLYISHSLAIDDAIEYGEMLQKELGFKNIMYSYIGSIIGSHTGPGLVAVFFHGKDRFK